MFSAPYVRPEILGFKKLKRGWGWKNSVKIERVTFGHFGPIFRLSFATQQAGLAVVRPSLQPKAGVS